MTGARKGNLRDTRQWLSIGRWSSAFAAAVRWWPALTLGIVLACAAGYLVAVVSPRSYEASVSLLVGPPSATGTEQASGRAAVAAYAALFTNLHFLQRASNQLPVGADPSILVASIQVHSDKSARLIEVAVRQSDPDVAAAIANSLARDAIATIERSGASDARRLLLLESARADASPVGLDATAIGLLSGTLAGIASYLFIALTEFGTAAVRRPRDLEELKIPHVGTAPTRPPWRFAAESGHTPGAMGYERIVDGLLSLGLLKTESVVFFFGITSGEDSADVAVNVALALALRGRRSVVQSFDEDFALGRWRGDSALAIGPRYAGGAKRSKSAAQLESAWTTAEDDSLTAGPRSGKVLALVHAGPPSTAAAASIGVSRAVGTVLVVRRFVTRQHDVQSAMEVFRRVGGQVMAALLYERK